MVTKKIIKNCKNSFVEEKFNQEVEKSGPYQKKCLGGYFDLSSKTYREFLL